MQTGKLTMHTIPCQADLRLLNCECCILVPYGGTLGCHRMPVYSKKEDMSEVEYGLNDFMF